ncbi:AtpZ/AtpI family protein [Mesorhizobium sp. LHD-90]|uniref:AtpZ/AtpI family protein n=1 Tax=Mesorhizobium sp. LHD-90 TaxID=3071414 RepID=UPI0027DFD701|nr:AtpZ/AtpI family protein [Mesorhizobium sp. LHD-90]MDQ6436045.1 AtpZ/AtpI family protein [Mesorhizobium sp. LHD-90]
MAGGKTPDKTGKTGPGDGGRPSAADLDLERRRQKLEASLASKGHGESNGEDKARQSSVTGYGQALKLSSEFIAGVAVGAGLGWLIDRLAGTSPWGLIVFLLLGFGAGVLNVMRSAGMIADAGIRASKRPEDGDRN